MKRERIETAHQCARTLLDRFDVNGPSDIRLDVFAKHLNARIVHAPLDGAEAQLVRTAERSTITLADRVTDVVAWRFNLAHELGHIALAHANTSDLACNPQRWSRARGFELEASACGSALLMPDKLVRPSCQVPKVDLEVPHQIARDFTVSILASAIRFTELANERCAAVFSVDGKVKWCARSKKFTKEIKRGKRLDPNSVAFDYFAKGDLDDRAQAVPADVWLKTSADEEIIEHSICAPKFRTVLSMLWVPESIAPLIGMRA